MLNSTAKPLHQLIYNCILCQERLQPYKLSEKQLTQVFLWLDIRRRGSVDVSDFYSKFIDLSQCELFYIFKYLDVQRKGGLTIDSLQNLLSTNQSMNACQRKDDAIKNFTNLIKILKATFHLLQQTKRKLNINSQYLKQFFYKATQMKKDRIDLKDLLMIFCQQGLDTNEKFINYLQNTIYWHEGLTLKEFVQVFSQIVVDDYPQIQKQQYEKSILNEEKPTVTAYLKNKTIDRYRVLAHPNSQIDKILQKYKNTNKCTETPKYQQYKQYSTRTTPILQKYALHKYQKIDLNSYKQKPQYSVEIPLQNAKSKIQDKYSNTLTDHQTEKIDKYNYQPEFQSSTKQIEKRRQQLRKGSMERQKIIDGLMNKNRTPNNQIYSTQPKNIYLQQNPKYLIEQDQIKTKISNYMNHQQQQPPPPRTPSPLSKPFYQTADYETVPQYGKIYDPYFRKDQLVRPASVAKASSPYFQRQLYSKFGGCDRSTTPQINHFYRRKLENPVKDTIYEKQNILRRAEEEATKKIQEIQRRARLKVMEKRSAAGLYNRWLK